ncbi:MAG: hypothetical protein RR035_07820 [Oscillibacter sp.]
MAASPGDASAACRRYVRRIRRYVRRIRRYVRRACRPQKFSILHKLYLSLVTDFTQGCLY